MVKVAARRLVGLGREPVAYRPDVFNAPGVGAADRDGAIIGLGLGALGVQQKDVVGVGRVLIQNFERINRINVAGAVVED